MEIKRIVTRDEKDRKRKRNYLIMGIVMVLLMIISPAAYGLFYNNDSSNGNTQDNNIVNYNNVKFTKDSNGYWQFSAGGGNFLTRYNPEELNKTKSSLMLTLSSYKDQVLSFEWNETQDGVFEIRRNFEGNAIPKRVVPRVCLTQNCSLDIPTKSCSEDKVISFRVPVEGEKERIYKEDNCVFIIVNETNQVKFADAFLFNIIGI